MSSAIRASGKCVLCAFRESECKSMSLFSLNKSAIRMRSGTKLSKRRAKNRKAYSENYWKKGDQRIPSPKQVFYAHRDQERNFMRNALVKSPPSILQKSLSTKDGDTSRKLNSGPRIPSKDSTYHLFGELVLNEFFELKEDLKPNQHNNLGESWGITSYEDLNEKLSKFRQKLVSCIKNAEDGIVNREENLLFYRLRKAFVSGNVKALKLELKYSFLSSIASKEFSHDEELRLAELADLSFPAEWYPATRALQRTIHLHVGPTNSGKTFHALQRLETAKNGIYAGPLRLLAHEVYSRFNAKGKLCGLVTGEEKRFPPGLKDHMYSCTVEMIPFNLLLDVAVIDEIQMICSPDRGWAWTAAVLGVQAREVHLCGELRTINIVKDLCKLVGDKFVIHHYERLSPLRLDNECIKSDLSNLRKGDAVILFSRLAINGMKQEIEKVTGKRCAIVYGSLPPEIRAQQAALFNDPNNDYDFLVASDAVGMGLNLSIRRIIFETTQKFDGTERRVMETSEIKQIAGRAGRYKTSNCDASTNTNQNLLLKLAPSSKSRNAKNKLKESNSTGLVTTLHRADFSIVKKSMAVEAPPIKSAGIAAPSDIVLRFASYFPPSTPFSYILLRLYEISSTLPPFQLCMPRDEITISDLIQPFNLSSRDRLTFTAAPISTRDAGMSYIIKELASCLAKQSSGRLIDMKSFKLELLDMNVNEHHSGSKGYLREAEALHKAVTLYLWLSYRFAGVYISQELAFHVKGLVEAKIDECLAVATYNPDRRKPISEKSWIIQSKENAVLEAMLNSNDDEQSKLNSGVENPALVEESDIPT